MKMISNRKLLKVLIPSVLLSLFLYSCGGYMAYLVAEFIAEHNQPEPDKINFNLYDLPRIYRIKANAVEIFKKIESEGLSEDDINRLEEVMQYESSISDIISKHLVTAYYSMILIDLKYLLEKLTANVNGVHTIFKPLSSMSDFSAIFQRMFFENLIPFMSDIEKRIGMLASLDPSKVHLKVKYLSLHLNIQGLQQILGVFNLKIEPHSFYITDSLLLNGNWTYVEVLLIGSLNNWLYVFENLLRSLTLGDTVTFGPILDNYSHITTSEAIPREIFFAHFLADSFHRDPQFLAFDPLEGKKIFSYDLRLHLDAALSYLTGRETILKYQNTLYAPPNPGLFEAINLELTKKQDDNFIQFLEDQNDPEPGKFSTGDTIYIPALENFIPQHYQFKNPLSSGTIEKLLEFGKSLEAQLENFNRKPSPVDISPILNSLFKDLHDYYTPDEPQPASFPEGLLKINAGSFFASAFTDSTFTGLRALFPAWVPNPDYSSCITDSEIGNRLDFIPGKRCTTEDNNPGFEVFESLMVFEMEKKNPDGSYQFFGKWVTGGNYYYGFISGVTSDQGHFDLFFIDRGIPNHDFFGDINLYGDVITGNIEPLPPDNLLPEEGVPLYYSGFQSPDFYGLVVIDASKIPLIPVCRNITGNNNPLFNINAIINCFRLQYHEPLRKIAEGMGIK